MAFMIAGQKWRLSIKAGVNPESLEKEEPQCEIRIKQHQSETGNWEGKELYLVLWLVAFLHPQQFLPTVDGVTEGNPSLLL